MIRTRQPVSEIEMTRLSTGITRLDEALGGGLIPGSMTMLIGATGIGKTQIGMQISQAGTSAEGVRGAVIDLSSRGDAQNHGGYSERIFGESLTVVEPGEPTLETAFAPSRPPDVLPFLGYSGRRVLRSQMDVDQWHGWQSELIRRMPLMYRFVYGHLIHGTRRFVVDGIEPQDSASESLQLDLLELIYHRMIRKEHDWLAREVLREHYREAETEVARRAYDHSESALVVLVTTKQSMLDQLMTEPLSDGDLAAGANTVILLGRTMRAGATGRGLYVAKHRGSYAEQNILNFDISDSGIEIAAS